MALIKLITGLVLITMGIHAGSIIIGLLGLICILSAANAVIWGFVSLAQGWKALQHTGKSS